MTEFSPSAGKKAETYDERTSLFHIPDQHTRRLSMIVTLLGEAEGTEDAARLLGEALPPGAYEAHAPHQTILNALKAEPNESEAARQIEPLLGEEELESLYVRMFFYPGREPHTD